MSEHTYHLQKYAGTSTRHTCPQCGHKGEFTYYVDERNVPIDESCGRCNRERCGYHLTPSEYFKAHPADKRNEFITWKQPESPKAIPVSYLPSSLLATDTHRDKNNLFRFMSKEFEMLRQTGYLISIMSGRLATGETITDYLPPFHRLTKKANYAN